LRSFEKISLLRRNPFGFARMVADAKPPDGQPDERQDSLQDEHLLPAIRPKQPAGERRGAGDRQRLAKQPARVGTGAFGMRKPVRQQHQCAGENRALSDTQKKPHEFKLPK